MDGLAQMRDDLDGWFRLTNRFLPPRHWPSFTAAYTSSAALVSSTYYQPGVE